MRPHKRIWNLTDTGFGVRNTNTALKQSRVGLSSRRDEVQLREGEYVEFQEEIAKRQWTQLAGSMAKYDPKIVMEFYDNAWPIEEGVRDKRSGCGANGSPLMKMPLISFWGIHWSWKRGNIASSVRRGAKPQDLIRRPWASCYAFQDRTLHRV